MRNMREYLTGEKIYGDDFSIEEIEAWYEDEAEGSTGFFPDEPPEAYTDAFIINYLYPFLTGEGLRCLAYGGAYGTELLSILDHFSEITVLEPGEKFQRDRIGGKPAHYVKPAPSGKMAFPDASFDCVICLNALHHVPNVSFILSEFGRVLKSGGTCIINEPITSMRAFDGIPRPGMTKRERGIPLQPFRQAIAAADLEIRQEILHTFGPLWKFNQLTHAFAGGGGKIRFTPCWNVSVELLL